MCTIIKVKRKITDDPVDCLIIECKKKKLLGADIIELSDEKSSEPPQNKNNRSPHLKQILKYVGSANNEEEIPVRIKEFNSKLALLENEIATVAAKPLKGVKSSKKTRSKLKQQVIGDGHEVVDGKKRIDYVLVNKKRGMEMEKNEEINEEKRFKQQTGGFIDDVNIIDVISTDYLVDEDESKDGDAEKKKKKNVGEEKTVEKITCNGVELIREKVTASGNSPNAKTSSGFGGKKDANDYVYDLYYTKTNDIHLDLLYPNNYEIKSYMHESSELIDENNDDDEEEIYEDEEDSNDELNWRNDYPDEEDDIDDEDDDEPRHFKNANRSHYEDEDDDYGDNYNEFGHEYNDDDDYNGKKLASYMKKSLILGDKERSRNEDDDDDEDDFDEYKHEDLETSYNSYKKRILKEFKADYNEDI